MTLRDVASALERMKAATLTQLAAELETYPRELEPLLDFWEHRGNIRRCSDSTCRACPVGRRPCPVKSAAGPHETAPVYEFVKEPVACPPKSWLQS